jgi:signal transduction histidine kinase
VDNATAIRYLTAMEEASKQLLAILEFERVYEQIGSEELVYVNVEKFFAEASALVSDFKGINLECRCGGLAVLADSLLRQLLYNLMDNTLKYGEKTTLIRLSCKKDGSSMLLIYEDDGVGMTDEVRSHLFEKGFGKGTGFGLYMIKRIIEAYGWTIEENGKFGIGARFTIKIPENKFRLKENI